MNNAKVISYSEELGPFEVTGELMSLTQTIDYVEVKIMIDKIDIKTNKGDSMKELNPTLDFNQLISGVSDGVYSYVQKLIIGLEKFQGMDMTRDEDKIRALIKKHVMEDSLAALVGNIKYSEKFVDDEITVALHELRNS